jgi:hypothetical protein
MSGPIEAGSALRSIGVPESGDPGWPGLDQAVQQTLEAAELLFEVEGVALVLLAEGKQLHWSTGSPPVAGGFEEAAALLSDGPCHEAVGTGAVQQVVGGTAEGRWPELAAALGRAGVGALLCVPVRVAGKAVGALLLVSRTPHCWAQPELWRAEAYAGVVGTMLGVQAAAERSERLNRQLQWALDRRVLIEQAKGVVMATDGLDATAAHQRIRSEARDRRVKVVDVAGELLSQARSSIAERPASGHEAHSA